MLPAAGQSVGWTAESSMNHSERPAQSRALTQDESLPAAAIDEATSVTERDRLPPGQSFRSLPDFCNPQSHSPLQ